MARLYRKRPLVVEAVELKLHGFIEAIEFLRAGGVHFLVKSAGILIRTPDGDMLAQPGDYIIRGVNGSYYPCKPDDFIASYEPIAGSQ